MDDRNLLPLLPYYFSFQVYDAVAYTLCTARVVSKMKHISKIKHILEFFYQVSQLFLLSFHQLCPEENLFGAPRPHFALSLDGSLQ